jgi:hypothetical protein
VKTRRRDYDARSEYERRDAVFHLVVFAYAGGRECLLTDRAAQLRTCTSRHATAEKHW